MIVNVQHVQNINQTRNLWLVFFPPLPQHLVSLRGTIPSRRPHMLFMDSDRQGLWQWTKKNKINEYVQWCAYKHKAHMYCVCVHTCAMFSQAFHHQREKASEHYWKKKKKKWPMTQPEMALQANRMKLMTLDRFQKTPEANEPQMDRKYICVSRISNLTWRMRVNLCMVSSKRSHKAITKETCSAPQTLWVRLVSHAILKLDYLLACWASGE